MISCFFAINPLGLPSESSSGINEYGQLETWKIAPHYYIRNAIVTSVTWNIMKMNWG